MSTEIQNIEWLKNRGYLHFSNKINLKRDKAKTLSKVFSKAFVARYAFFPLIHSTIKERRYKKSNNGRSHSTVDDTGNQKSCAKIRPLHYSTHMDSIIFGYYSAELTKLYENELQKNQTLNESIIAYRKVPIKDGDKNKSTIHFSHEAFQEIRKRAELQDCVVLKFDIESYFSTIDHKILKRAWTSLLGTQCLPPDHYNVYKAATHFSYILKDDLRLKSKSKKDRRPPFDEKNLSTIRKKGIQSYFESPEHFRQAIKEGKLTIHKHPFRNRDKKPRGIPQGLPISATLANLYLLDFDKKVIQEVVTERKGFYRRYSDDIIIVCQPEEASIIENYIKEIIEENKITISDSKTENFLFKKDRLNKVVSIKLSKNHSSIGTPFTYLGFEFYGKKTLVKSANLAKFYRRMIYSVKRKVRRATVMASKRPDNKIILYRRQLLRLYSLIKLDATKARTKIKWLSKNNVGEYFFKTKEIDKEFNSNYFNYINRAASIMEEPAIKSQIKKHSKIFNKAILKHVVKALNRRG